MCSLACFGGSLVVLTMIVGLCWEGTYEGEVDAVSGVSGEIVSMLRRFSPED